jgi:leucyl aminopeptidase
MTVKFVLVALLAAFSRGLAAPATAPDTTRSTDLRLVKRSEADPGIWLTEDQILERLASKNTGFIDITDIRDPEVLAVLSDVESSGISGTAVSYPTGALHKDEGSRILAKIDTTGPKSWLKTYSE